MRIARRWIPPAPARSFSPPCRTRISLTAVMDSTPPSTQWTWRGHSLGDYPSPAETRFDADRLQFNGKVDHNFNARHKVAVNYTNERIDSDYYNSGVAGLWPGYYPQQMQLRPQVFTVNFTSTLTSNIVNEARYGYRRSFQVYLWPVGSAGSRKTQSSPVAPVARRKECGWPDFSNRLRALRRRSNERE